MKNPRARRAARARPRAPMATPPIYTLAQIRNGTGFRRGQRFMRLEDFTRQPIRVKFTVDQDARFEECNGEARPLTEAEYAENVYMGCPTHPRGWKGNDTTANDQPGRGVCACGTLYQPIRYEEYLAYYGNPDRHVYLGIIVQRQCPTCGSWETQSSLWSIDFMDDDREYDAINIDQWMDEATATALPGYAGELAREQIAEARA